MKYYCSTIPPTLAVKLKEKGINIPTIAKYIIGNQVREYDKDYDDDMPIIGKREYHDGDLITYDRIDKECNPVCCNAPTYAEVFDWMMEQGVDMEHSTAPLFVVWDKNDGALAFKGKTWHEAANKAIEKALTLI